MPNPLTRQPRRAEYAPGTAPGAPSPGATSTSACNGINAAYRANSRSEAAPQSVVHAPEPPLERIQPHRAVRLGGPFTVHFTSYPSTVHYI